MRVTPAGPESARAEAVPARGQSEVCAWSVRVQSGPGHPLEHRSRGARVDARSAGLDAVRGGVDESEGGLDAHPELAGGDGWVEGREHLHPEFDVASLQSTHGAPLGFWEG